jgi:hypothetical protein
MRTQVSIAGPMGLAVGRPRSNPPRERTILRALGMRVTIAGHGGIGRA